MTGEELRALRITANISRVELGRYLGWKGAALTVERNIRKLERQDEIFPEVASQVLKLAQDRLLAARRSHASREF